MSDPSEYARQLETYLCQKNKGHLIRVVGPAFDMVRGWAEGGVPLKIVMRGIDRCCERHDAKGGRRRPVRIEFCEVDVLDAFDEWRRAVGVPAGEAAAVEAPARKPALAAHVERAIARLANVRGPGAAATELHDVIDGIIRELEEIAGAAIKARGEARAALVGRLAELDARLIASATGQLTPDRVAVLQAEATEELAAFGSRMPPEARIRATEAAFARLVREDARLPLLAYE